MASGFSALAAALVVGARKDYGRQALLPHNAMYVLLGAGLLWFGWFGFNGGSGFNDRRRQRARLHQHAARRRPARSSPGSSLDLIRGRKVTAIGAATAIIVGCVLITPAGGFISPGWAMVLGFLGALPCYAMIVWRPRTRVDETLDVLAAHGIAGFTGILFIGLVAQIGWNGLADGLFYGNADQLLDQALAAIAAPAYAFTVTFVLLKLIGAVIDRASAKADAAVVRALANEATARTLVDAAAEKVNATTQVKEAAERAKTAADEAARAAQTASIEPGDTGAVPSAPQIDLVVAADLANATEAVRTALAAKAKADENAASALVSLSAARKNAELARAAAEQAAAEKDAAELVLIASAQKREAAEKDAAAAKAEADEAAAVAADSSVAAVRAAGAVTAAVREAIAAKAVAEGAVKAAATMAAAADAAATELADRNAALADAQARLREAEDAEAAAIAVANAVVAAAAEADAKAKQAAEAAKLAADAEAGAKADVDAAVLTAAKAQKGLSTFDAGPASLAPVAGDNDVPTPKPRRPKPAPQPNKPFTIVPLLGQ